MRDHCPGDVLKPASDLFHPPGVLVEGAGPAGIKSQEPLAGRTADEEAIGLMVSQVPHERASGPRLKDVPEQMLPGPSLERNPPMPRHASSQLHGKYASSGCGR